MGKRDKKKKLKSQDSELATNSKLNKLSKQQKQLEKVKTSKKLEDDFDIDALLAEFKSNNISGEPVWTLCDAPTRRSNSCILVFSGSNHELILFGGELYDGKSVTMFNSLYRFNIEKCLWSQCTGGISPEPRSGCQIVQISEVSYMFGGEFVSPNESTFFHYKDFWMFDLHSSAWSQISTYPQPPPRSGHRMVAYKHLIILFGGFYAQGSSMRYYNDLWVFNTHNQKWSLVNVEGGPSKRSGFQFLQYNDSCLLYGGYTQTTAKNPVGMVFTDLWVLNLNATSTIISKSNSNEFGSWSWEKRKKCGGNGPGYYASLIKLKNWLYNSSP